MERRSLPRKAPEERTTPEAHRAIVQARIDRLRAQGLCTVCAKEPLLPGHRWWCKACRQVSRERDRVRQEARIARLKAANLCIGCETAPPLAGKLKCWPCLVKSRQSAAASRARNWKGKWLKSRKATLAQLAEATEGEKA